MLQEAAVEGRPRRVGPRDPERRLLGRVDARLRQGEHAGQVGVGRQPEHETLRSDPQPEQRPGRVEGRAGGVTAAMGTRRYTPAMGAVETMEEFFEKLNSGDREGAVAMMDEKTEMRVHVGDNVQTLRGVERVGGWFLRSDAGLRMIPGDIRDTGNTYEADLLVVRPGAPTQHIDATFRVEAGRITAINIAPR